MKIEMKPCELAIDKDAVQSVLIIPDTFWHSLEDSAYTSTALSFHKELKNTLPVEFLTPPKALIEQRSSEWFGPILYLAANIVQNNPDIFDLIIDAVKICATRITKKDEAALVRLRIICEESNETKKTELSYEGGVEGLKEIKSVLKGVINGK
jgi:hypothetical protein